MGATTKKTISSRISVFIKADSGGLDPDLNLALKKKSGSRFDTSKIISGFDLNST